MPGASAILTFILRPSYLSPINSKQTLFPPIPAVLLAAEVAPLAVPLAAGHDMVDAEHALESLKQAVAAVVAVESGQAFVGLHGQAHAVVVGVLDAGHECRYRRLKVGSIGRHGYAKAGGMSFQLLPFTCFLDGDVLLVEDVILGVGADEERVVLAVEEKHAVASAPRVDVE